MGALARPPVRAWEVHPLSSRSHYREQQQVLVSLNFGAISSSLQFYDRDSALDIVEQVEFLLPNPPQQQQQQLLDSTLVCTLHRSALLDPALQDKLPNLVVREGVCDDGRKVFLNLLRGNNASFSATFTIPNSLDWLYVDRVVSAAAAVGGEEEESSALYVIYPKSSASGDKEHTHAQCRMVHLANRNEYEMQDFQRDAKTTTTTTQQQQGIFKLAVAANREFSLVSGDTIESVSNAIAIIISRVNGIFQRELGVFFQLVEGNNELLCTSSNTAMCAEMLPNDDSEDVLLYNAIKFIQKRGVREQDFDLGHVFTTNSGGVAAWGVLCDPEWKASGNTGMSSPVGDAFSVDYVAHEIGHQLGGSHTHRDCNGERNEDSSMTAVEPGSGSTIMAYAGLCGPTNLQRHSDAYFHPTSLVEMRGFIQDKFNQCGEPQRVGAQNSAPSLSSALPTKCTIPLKNAFYLSGAGGNQASTMFQWDHVFDNGGGDAKSSYTYKFKDLSTPRFRSWKPRKSATRYFPNLYYLTHGLHLRDPYRWFEQLPSKSTSMTFRVVARSFFDANAHLEKMDAAQFGAFDYKDVTVTFSSSMPALLFTAATRQRLLASITSRLYAGSAFSFAWTPPPRVGLDKVEILIARNTMLQVVPNAYAVDSDLHIKELDWISLGVVPHTGNATLVLPSHLLEDGEEEVEVNFMLRARGGGGAAASEYCVPFDYVPRCKLFAPSAGAVVTPAPTIRPTTNAYFGPTTTSAPTPPTTRDLFTSLVPSDGSSSALQRLYTCPGKSCSTLPTCFAMETQEKRFVEFYFTAPSTAYYVFSTRSADATCLDTVMAIGSSCDDDGADAATTTTTTGGFSLLTRTLTRGTSVTILVGSYNSRCNVGDVVAMTATRVTKIQSGETDMEVAAAGVTTCALGEANCLQTVAACSSNDALALQNARFASFAFMPKYSARYEFTVRLPEGCRHASPPVLAYGQEVCVALEGEAPAPLALDLEKSLEAMLYIANTRTRRDEYEYEEEEEGSCKPLLSVSPPYHVVEPSTAGKQVNYAATCLAGTFGCAPTACLKAKKFLAFSFTASSDDGAEELAYVLSPTSNNKQCASKLVMVVDGMCRAMGGSSAGKKAVNKLVLENVRRGQRVKVFLGVKNDACSTSKTLGLKVVARK